MSVCVECGEFELYYVLACGDSAVGESNILLFAGQELRELQAEIRTMDVAFGSLDRASASGTPDDVVKAQDHLAGMLKSYVSPMANLPSKHLVQAYAINGKKWTRIRSDKMRNHWRSYKIDKSLLTARNQSGRGNQLSREELRRAFSSTASKIKDDLKQGISFKSQIAKGSVSGSVSDLWDANWTRWVDAVNESLTYSGRSANHDLSAGAQLLRGYAGFGLQLGYNPKKNSYGLSGNAEARAIIAEAKAKFDGYVPHRDGWRAMIGFSSSRASAAGQQQSLDFGYFRGRLTLTAHAMLGASIYGTAGVEYAPKSGGGLAIKPAMADTKGEIALGAFAGVEAGGSATGALEWRNPGVTNATTGKVVTASGWLEIISVGVSIAANAGAGAEAVFKITYEKGRFMFRCQAQAVLGVGAKGGLSGAVGAGAIFDFVIYVYNQLKDNNFALLQFISEAAFHAVVGVVLYAVEFGVNAAKAIGSGLDAAIQLVMRPIQAADAAEAYARKIKARPTTLMFAPPEAKGAILYRLSETFFFSFEEHQEAAILTVMGTMQSRSEWEKVVERITPTGRKSSAAAGLARLRGVLDGGSRRSFENMRRLLERLPSTVMIAGAPVVIRDVA